MFEASTKHKPATIRAQRHRDSLSPRTPHGSAHSKKMQMHSQARSRTCAATIVTAFLIHFLRSRGRRVCIFMSTLSAGCNFISSYLRFRRFRCKHGIARQIVEIVLHADGALDITNPDNGHGKPKGKHRGREPRCESLIPQYGLDAYRTVTRRLSLRERLAAATAAQCNYFTLGKTH